MIRQFSIGIGITVNNKSFVSRLKIFKLISVVNSQKMPRAVDRLFEQPWKPQNGINRDFQLMFRDSEFYVQKKKKIWKIWKFEFEVQIKESYVL